MAERNVEGSFKSLFKKADTLKDKCDGLQRTVDLMQWQVKALMWALGVAAIVLAGMIRY